MLRLKLPQQLRLFLLIARRQTSLLLALVIHHLLDHASRIAVKVPKLRVLRLDLGDVDLWCRGDDVRPPFHLVHFVEVDIAGFETAADGG